MMNNNLQVIDERQVLGKEFKIYGNFGNPLFLAKDVMTWIDYSENNTYRFVGMVDDAEKLLLQIVIAGQVREAWFLTEDGLYEVLMQSRKPIAKEFKKKVKEILKEIRKYNGYIVTNEEHSDEEIMAKALMVAQRTIERKNLLILEQNKVIEEQKPKVEYYHKVLDGDGLATVTSVASMFSVTARKLNVTLNQLGIQFRQGNTWHLYAKYKDKGYVKHIQYYTNLGNVNIHMKWTPKGIEFLVNLLEEKMGWEVTKITNSLTA